MVRAFCQPHTNTFNEQSKMATALTPQTDVTSETVKLTDGENRDSSLGQLTENKID